jgi:hypothetical protein
MEEILKTIVKKTQCDRALVISLQQDKDNPNMHKLINAYRYTADTRLEADALLTVPEEECTGHRYTEILRQIFTEGYFSFSIENLKDLSSNSQTFFAALFRKSGIQRVVCYKLNETSFLSLHFCRKESGDFPKDLISEEVENLICALDIKNKGVIESFIRSLCFW